MKYKTDFKCKIPFSNKIFQQILQFYLFECPVDGTSKRGTDFGSLGWKGSKQFALLKKKMLGISDSELATHYYPCSKTELSTAFDIVDKLEVPVEYCVFLKHDEKTVMQSLYSAIRNALAHGSFNVYSYRKIRIFYFENYDGYLKAKIVLKEDTLVEWIKYIKKEK